MKIGVISDTHLYNYSLELKQIVDTHYPVNQVIKGLLFFNPGSATEKRFTKKNTVGILEINERITGKIIEI